MNQANEDSNIVIAGIQAVETERGLEAPVYKKGPKIINIRMGQDVQEILTKTSKLLENGELQDENENRIAVFDKNKMQELKEARANRKIKAKIVANNKMKAKRAKSKEQEDERVG